jgi:hypothetical protein
MPRKTTSIPDDLREFLTRKKQLRYNLRLCETGKVTLKRLEDLRLDSIYIDSEGSPHSELDPNKGREGYYAVPAVSLIAKCQHYDPDGILVWLPDQSCYGTWDNDHWDVLIFPKVSWTEIVKDPVPFINAQWKRGVACEYLTPWERYEFHDGKPW